MALAGRRKKVVARGGIKGSQWRIEWDSRDQEQRFEKLLNRNAQKVGNFLAGKVKQRLSVGQVVYRSRSRIGGQGGLRSAQAATPGAPPRVLTGRLRQSVDFKILRGSRSVSVMIGAFTKYARRMELGWPAGALQGVFAFVGWVGNAHPYLRPTIADNRKKLLQLFTASPAKTRRKRVA